MQAAKWFTKVLTHKNTGFKKIVANHVSFSQC